MEIKRRLASGRFNSFIRDSTFTIVGVSRPYEPLSEKWAETGTTMAMQKMVLAAEVQGVGSC